MSNVKRCIACGGSNQFLFRAIIEGQEYFYHGSHDCHASQVDMLATIAKAHAKFKCADYERLRDALIKIRNIAESTTASSHEDWETVYELTHDAIVAPAAGSLEEADAPKAARKDKE